MVDIIFIDLDGTIIKTKSGKTFPIDTNDWELKHKVIIYVKLLLDKHPYKVVLLTNQAGISKGLVNGKDFGIKLDNINSYLPWKFEHIFIADSMNSRLRKPKIHGVLEDLRKKGLIPSDKSIMIGDAGGRAKDFSNSDLKFANNMGIDFIHVDDIK